MPRVWRNPKVYTFRPEKEKQKFEISTATIWILLMLLLLTGLVYFFLFSNYFKIKNVYIVGADVFENEISDIIQQNIAQKSNIFLFPDKLIEQRISQDYSVFSQVTITKGIPNAIKVDLIKREPILIYSHQDKNFLVDQGGIAFESKNIPNNLPKVDKDQEINLGDKAFTQDFVSFVKKLWDIFPVKTHLKIVKIQVPETDFVLEVFVEPGWKAIFDTTKDCQRQVDSLALLLPEISGQKIEYIDLRLEEKIYYK